MLTSLSRVLAQGAWLAPHRRLLTQHWTRTVCSRPPPTDRTPEALLAALQEADKQAIRQSYLESVAAAADFVDSLQPAEASHSDAHSMADRAATLPSNAMSRADTTPEASGSALATAAESPTASDIALVARLEDYLIDWARSVAAEPALLAENWLRSLRRADRRDLTDSADLGSASPSLMGVDKVLDGLARLAARGILGAPGAQLRSVIERKRSEKASTPPGIASTIWRSTRGLEMKAWREGAEGARLKGRYKDIPRLTRPAPRRRAGGPGRERSHRVEASGEESRQAAATTSGGTGGNAIDVGTPAYRGFTGGGGEL